jgi:hypothetical protein
VAGRGRQINHVLGGRGFGERQAERQNVMGIVMLPRVSPETTIESALNLLLKHKRGGVVSVNRNGRYSLLYASDLHLAKATKIKTVGGVKKRRRALLLDNREARKFGVDLVRPWQTEQGYDRMFDQHKADFAIALELSDMIAVVTRHEGQERALSTTGGYKCNGTPAHRFPDPLVELRQECPRYPECSMTSGRIPTIGRG